MLLFNMMQSVCMVNYFVIKGNVYIGKIGFYSHILNNDLYLVAVHEKEMIAVQ